MNSNLAERIPALSKDRAQELTQKMASLAKDGIVFSEPYTRGPYTVIPVSQHSTGRRRYIARPVAVLVAGPEGVEVKPIQKETRSLFIKAMIAGSIALGTAFAFHPPWRPDASLVEDAVRQIEARRGRPAKAG